MTSRIDTPDREQTTADALMAQPVALTSSLLKSVGPFKDGVLDVEFTTTGKRYRYHGVTVEHYYGLLKAESPGQYFNRHIKAGCACEPVPTAPAEQPVDAMVNG